MVWVTIHHIEFRVYYTHALRSDETSWMTWSVTVSSLPAAHYCLQNKAIHKQLLPTAVKTWDIDGTGWIEGWWQHGTLTTPSGEQMIILWFPVSAMYTLSCWTKTLPGNRRTWLPVDVPTLIGRLWPLIESLKTSRAQSRKFHSSSLWPSPKDQVSC